MSLHYLTKFQSSKIVVFRTEWIKLPWKNSTTQKHCWKTFANTGVDVSIISFTDKKIVSTAILKNPATDCAQLPCQWKSCRGKYRSYSAVSQALTVSVCQSNESNWSTAFWHSLILMSYNSFFNIRTTNNSFCPSYTNYPARSASLG